MVACCNWTREWWDTLREKYSLVASLAVVDELRRGTHPYQQEKLGLVKSLPLLPVDQEVERIVEAYIERRMMPNDPGGDALHLALASYHKCDILLTWNCRHLANYTKMNQIRVINTMMGLHVPAILTPFELLERRDDDERR